MRLKRVSLPVTDTKDTTMAETGLPRSFLRSMLLLALRTGSSHGYELMEQLVAGGLSVDLAGIYRMLRTFEQGELVVASWERSTLGPPRRVYDLTDSGEAAAVVAIDELTRARDQLSAALAATHVAR